MRHLLVCASFVLVLFMVFMALMNDVQVSH
jgi:hypothetical protein